VATVSLSITMLHATLVITAFMVTIQCALRTSRATSTRAG
jgi:hypothetical protein